MKNTKRLFGMIMGGFVGDAIGVPYEFMSREDIARNPCTTMRGYGTYQQPIGSWSDDSSMLFCLTESIIEGYTKTLVMEKFYKWYSEESYTATGVRFDIGLTTQAALQAYGNGVPIDKCGKNGRMDNGNGSLMRTAPLIYLLKGKNLEQRYLLVKEVSALTHGHPISCLSCFFFCEILLNILMGSDKYEAYTIACNSLLDVIPFADYPESEVYYSFSSILSNELFSLPVEEIISDGYVVNTLEAVLWSFYTTASYQEAVLTAVNLGSDTDTTAAIVGNLAGMWYGADSIPLNWENQLQRVLDITDLAISYSKLF